MTSGFRAVAVAALTAALLTIPGCSRPVPKRSGAGAPPVAATTDDPTAPAEADTDRTAVVPIEWRDCGGGLECGSVSVPVDYSAPDDAQLDIALTRVPAGGDAVGSVFVNPGGPGASGIELIRNGFRLDPQSAMRYHLVGFDPRGIGDSNPLACTVDRAGSAMPDLSPDSNEELQRLDELAVEIVENCVASDGALLPHLTTTNVARDLDRLRQAVGDDVLHYYGLSYGTLLAVRYGELFGESVGHLVLDGVVDPQADLASLLRQQAIAFETGFERLDDRCGEVGCPDDGIAATFDRVHDRLEAGGPVGGVGTPELVMASLLPAYSPSILPAYVTALTRAEGGDYAAIEAMSDFFVGSISFTAYAAFACADGRPPSGSESWERFAGELETQAPRFGAVVANELRVCAYWPEPADDRIDEVTAASLAGIDVPVLVVGNTGDAATPLVNAERVAELLPDARLVVVDSDRHTAYNGSSCVRDLVADYLADRPPADASRCSAE